jgi:hypothetical protein
MCVYIPKKKQRTIVIDETTDIFVSVRQKKNQEKLCEEKKINYTGKKEKQQSIVQGYIIIKIKEKIYSDLTHKTNKK